MNRADRLQCRHVLEFGVTQTKQYLGEVWVNEGGERLLRPLTRIPLGLPSCRRPCGLRVPGGRELGARLPVMTDSRDRSGVASTLMIFPNCITVTPETPR